MVSKNQTQTENKPIRRTRKRTAAATPRKRATRPRPAAKGKKTKKKTTTKKSRLWIWTETPRWVIWAVTGVVAVAYLTFVYVRYLKPYFYRWDFGNMYEGHPVVHGIDVSHHQGDINWSKLSQVEHEGSGIRFVFMKATEGADWVDSSFEENFANARQHGFIRGAYHFFSNTSPARKQAELFCKQVKLGPNDLPPVLDVETKGNYSEDSLRIEVKNWLHQVEAHYGVKPIIYASHNFKERYLNDKELNAYPFWIAHYYVDSLAYKGEWSFWQHTDKGKLPGIKGRVDMNVFNGNLDDLKKMTIKPDTTAETKK